MMNILDELEAVVGRGRIRQGELLESHTLRKIGGPAEFYIEIDKIDGLVKLAIRARELGVPVFILGGGSLVTISDTGVSGLVIKNSCRYFDKSSMRGTIRENQIGVQEVLVSAESGVIMNQLVRFTIEEGLSGLEYQLGLPGTVGGAISTNSKYTSPTVTTKYVKDFLHSIRILSKEGEVQTYTGELPYFVQLDDTWEEETQDIILSLVFKLMPEDKALLWERGREAVEFRSKFESRNSKSETKLNF